MLFNNVSDTIILSSLVMSARAARLQELQCVLCSEILREAVMMPCCAACCCHSCARTNLAHSGDA